MALDILQSKSRDDYLLLLQVHRQLMVHLLFDDDRHPRELESLHVWRLHWASFTFLLGSKDLREVMRKTGIIQKTCLLLVALAEVKLEA